MFGYKKSVHAVRGLNIEISISSSLLLTLSPLCFLLGTGSQNHFTQQLCICAQLSNEAKVDISSTYLP